MNTANFSVDSRQLPAMDSVVALTAWIDRHEELIVSHLLAHEDGDAEGNTLCAVFLSRNGDGEYVIRLCDGFSDALMIWRQQHRLRPVLGLAYAEARINIWLAQRERMGYAVQWSARRLRAASAGIPHAA